MPRRVSRLIRKAIARWCEYRFEKALPEVREIKRARAEASRQHRSTRQFDKALKALVTARLELEANHVGR